MVVGMHRVPRATIATLVLALHASDAAGDCPPGVSAPSVVTVVASTQSPAIDAWIVAPDCTYTTEYVVGSDSLLRLNRQDIQLVASLPTGAKKLEIYSNQLSSADLSNAMNLKEIYISNAGAALFASFKLPGTLNALKLVRATVDAVGSVDKLNLPDSITTLSFQSLGLSSLKSMPSSLTSMDLVENKFTGINFPLPPKLVRLIMDKNPITTLERVTFPASFKHFSCEACGIETIRGVKWSKLNTLYLADNPIREFEVRQSDFDNLDALSTIGLKANRPVCSDAEATVKYTQNHDFCVISDERFEVLYGGGTTTKSPLTSSPSPSGEDSGGSEGTGGNGNSNNRNGTSPDDSGSRALGGEEQASNGSDHSGGGGSKKSKGADSGTTSSSSSSIVTSIFIAVSCVFGILLAVVGFRLYRASKRNRDREGETPGNTLMPFDTPVFSSSQDPSSSSGGNDGGASTAQEYLSNDIRNDKAILPFRIDPKDISLSKQIARGGFGVIFRGVYGGRAVAVKQMLPDAWRNETQLMDFMDEIRLCASLSHPKIVEFIGVAWVSLRDISVIIEFMAGGDLHAVLHKHARAQSMSSSSTSFASGAEASSSSSSASCEPSEHEWFEQWTTSSINSKTLIARDVAEAVVYLHSFSDPIVHRDLKARNVLLDTEGNAKLSDFGISRKITVDETMTSEVGTIAWIAPEVLRGDRYSEQADIYSFGVLLVELDKCRHPYAGEEIEMLMDGSSVRLAPLGLPSQRLDQPSMQHQSMQIAMLVSAGRLRPKPSVSCPARVQALITRCLSFAPEDRPSAMEASYVLRAILEEL